MIEMAVNDWDAFLRSEWIVDGRAMTACSGRMNGVANAKRMIAVSMMLA